MLLDQTLTSLAVL